MPKEYEIENFDILKNFTHDGLKYGIYKLKINGDWKIVTRNRDNFSVIVQFQDSDELMELNTKLKLEILSLLKEEY